MRYEGPIYRPPSEADSLIVQATVGCPHNKCTFCMVYKSGPPFRVRRTEDVIEDLEAARKEYGSLVRSIFFPAGNTIAAPTDMLVSVFKAAGRIFPEAERMTVYGSAKYILEKGEKNLRRLAEAGLSRVHVGLESGHDGVLSDIKKGADRAGQIEAGRMLKSAGIENSTYVMLGIGGRDKSSEHVIATASALNEIRPEFVRLRTFVPKIKTPLLSRVQKGEFKMEGPHEILRETRLMLGNITAETSIRSDHYTNYINLFGELPEDREKLIRKIDNALRLDERNFRPFFIGKE